MDIRIPIENALEALEWSFVNIEMTDQKHFMCFIPVLERNGMLRTNPNRLLKRLQSQKYYFGGILDDYLIFYFEDKDKAMLCKLKFG